ncbi:MAG: 2-amino-4-hydroxy-6-hydroxymethyldihydropteridine diphosphokinase [Thermodesulfobacteriota bacterium]
MTVSFQPTTSWSPALIGLGSNLGDGRAQLAAAWARLAAAEGIRPGAISRPYATAPVGVETSRPFTNAVGMVHTVLEPETLLGVLLAIETAMGRDRRQGPDRPVDLDLLTHGERRITSPSLILPHPRLCERAFVLVPLVELVPDGRHPVLSHTWAELLAALGPGGSHGVEPRSWRPGEIKL